MKIICSDCKKVIGEQAPFNNPSTIAAKCSKCIAKEKKDVRKFEPASTSKDGQEVVLENGLKGKLWAAKTEDAKLSFYELGLAGKKFACGEKDRGEFQKQLEEMNSELYDVSFLHSITCTLPASTRGRKKKDVDAQAKAEKQESIQYNCTVQVNKRLAESMYDAKTRQLTGIVDILAQAAARAAEAATPERQNEAK
jgi:hypothetical protein